MWVSAELEKVPTSVAICVSTLIRIERKFCKTTKYVADNDSEFRDEFHAIAINLRAFYCPGINPQEDVQRLSHYYIIFSAA